MSRPIYTRAALLGEVGDVTVTTPADTSVTVVPSADPIEDPSSLDLPDSTLSDDPNAMLAALLRGELDDTPTVVVDNAGGSIPDQNDSVAVIDDNTDVDAADEIADQTADAIDDSADEVATAFEQAEQKLCLADEIGQYGLSASGLLVGRELGLLSGAGFDAMSAESLTMSPIEAGSRECGMSQESLISSAGKSIANLGARALTHSDAVVRRLLNMATKEEMEVIKLVSGKTFGPVADSVAHAGMLDGIARNAWNTKNVGIGDVVRNAGKAAIRPRNAAIAIAVVGAIAGVTKLVQVGFKGVPAPGTAVKDMNTWFGKVRSQISAIKWPFGKLTVKDTTEHVTTPTVRDRIGRLFCKDRVVTSAKDAYRTMAGYTVAAKEWTAQSLKAFKDGFVRAMSALKQALTGGGEGFIRTIRNGFTGAAGEGASKSALILSRGAYVAAVFSVVALISTTIFFVVAGGCRVIRHQLAD